MSIQQHLQNTIFDNPIRWRETITLARQRGKWFWRSLFAVTIFLLIAPILWGFKAPFAQHLSTALAFLLIANIVLYPLMSLRAITTAYDSVARERRDKTWDLLMLTGVGTWQLVLGKWIGTMRSLLSGFAWLYGLRIGTYLWYIAQISLETQIQAEANSTAQWSYELYQRTRDSLFLSDVNFADDSWIYILLTMLAFTLLELAFSSALGVSLAFFNFKGRTGSGLAVAARIVLPMLLFFGMMFGTGMLRLDGQPAADYSYETETTLFTFSGILIDNGAISSAAMLDDAYEQRRTSDTSPDQGVVTGHALGLLTYLLLTIGTLFVGQTAAHFAGVNMAGAPQVLPKRKAKRETPVISADVPQQAHMLTPEHGSSNAFEIADAAEYRAEVYHYQRRLGRMFLRLSHSNREPLYVQLGGVAYIEAPAFWKGANFRAASQAEFDAFVHERQLPLNSLMAEQVRLYVLDEARVRIVASSVQVLDELPSNI